MLLRPLRRFEAFALAVFRVGVGMLFMQHGVQKLFGLLGGHVVDLGTRLGVAGVLELVGGFFLVVGLLTRPVALVLAGEMLAAYYLAHLPRGMVPIENRGELALLYLLAFLYLGARGPGSASADWVLFRDRGGGEAGNTLSEPPDQTPGGEPL